MRLRLIIVSFLTGTGILLTGRVSAQEIDFDSLLIREIEVENPTYMPVIGFGAGTTHFFGEVRRGPTTVEVWSNRITCDDRVSDKPR